MVTRSKPTAEAYSASHMSVAVLALLSSAGFSRSSSGAADLMAEVMQRYIQLIGSTCAQHANHAGRTIISPHDVRASLEHILGGDPIEELLDWAEQEGRLPTPEDAAPHTNGIDGAHVEATTSALPAALQDPMRGKDLLRILNTGRVPPSPSEMDEIHFQPLPSNEFEQAAAESIIRESMTKQLVWPSRSSSLRANGEASTQGSSSTDDLDTLSFSDIEDGEESDTSEHQHATNGRLSPYAQKRRRTDAPQYTSARHFGEAVIDYVPAYLPTFPGAPSCTESAEAAASGPATETLPGSGEAASGVNTHDEVHVKLEPVEVDPEYVLEEQRRRELAQRRADEAAAAAAAAAAAEAAKNEDANIDESKAAIVVQKTAEERAAEAEKAFEALQARRILRDSWRESVTYDSSTLAATYPKDELRDLEQNVASVLSDTSIASIAPATSSLRAFAAEYQALVEDPTSSSAAGIYLTPSGPTHQDAATKRRRLAHALADASRYAPNDSLYAAVAARPSVIPFNPGPSWLVSTLPPPTLYEDNVEVANALSAPVLTPVRPQGRPAALIPPSGALVPTLGHRHPSQLTIGARVVASAELLKRVSRIDDPIPILDDKHAERFFHGLPASRDLLGGSGSSSDLSSNISSTRSSGGGGSGSGNSTLRPALEKLVLQMREKEAEILPEEDKEELQRRQQELQLQLQAALASENSGGGKDSTVLSSGLIADSYASRIRNGNITMVHTWDWTPRDPYDAMLPGKKVRAPGRRGVGPVALEKRGRTESANSELGEAATNGAGV
ncbi:BTP domain-containing protein [Pseudozyma hubeiensis]|nr:BTP domain-containing protein [Pseudozyma hubeiensis]